MQAMPSPVNSILGPGHSKAKTMAEKDKETADKDLAFDYKLYVWC